MLHLKCKTSKHAPKIITPAGALKPCPLHYTKGAEGKGKSQCSFTKHTLYVVTQAGGTMWEGKEDAVLFYPDV